MIEAERVYLIIPPRIEVHEHFTQSLHLPPFPLVEWQAAVQQSPSLPESSTNPSCGVVVHIHRFHPPT